VLAAFHFWIIVYMDPSTGFFGPAKDLAPVAGLVGGMCGLILGAALGLFLTLKQRGPIFGTVSGLILGFSLCLLAIALEGMPDWNSRGAVFITGFVPLGAISGFFTSLIVPVVKSWVNANDGNYIGLNLQQRKINESKPS
jgi:hypothetical protein